jgi:hypothetical protein
VASMPKVVGSFLPERAKITPATAAIRHRTLYRTNLAIFRLQQPATRLGSFLKKAAKRQFEVLGIELAENAADSRRQGGLNVLSSIPDEVK